MIRKTSVQYLVQEGLGYCCLYFFFSHFQDAEMIAARLGCSLSAVYKQRARLLAGELQCEGKDRCLQKLIRPPSQ